MTPTHDGAQKRADTHPLRVPRPVLPGRAARSERGQAMLEFLIALPLLLLIVFLIVSFGKGFRLKQRAVVASRHAAWHIAMRGYQGELELDPFQDNFFYGDETASHSGGGGPGSGKDDFVNRLNLGAGPMIEYWNDRSPSLSGTSFRRAAVDYTPPGRVYRYALERIGERSGRERQWWQWGDVNMWRFFGEHLMEEATDRRQDMRDEVDQAAQQGLSTIDDAVLYEELLKDFSSHRQRMDQYYGGWIGSWRRG